MGKNFISHSSANNAERLAMHDWLAEHGWSDVFLDVIDPPLTSISVSKSANKSRESLFLAVRRGRQPDVAARGNSQRLELLGLDQDGWPFDRDAMLSQ